MEVGSCYDKLWWARGTHGGQTLLIVARSGGDLCHALYLLDLSLGRTGTSRGVWLTFSGLPAFRYAQIAQMFQSCPSACLSRTVCLESERAQWEAALVCLGGSNLVIGMSRFEMSHEGAAMEVLIATFHSSRRC